MKLTAPSPCKINLLLNILRKRTDGFHELETVMHPVNLCDEIVVENLGTEIELTCNDPALPVDSRNLVYRAAVAFRKVAGVNDGLRLHLEKRIPMAAGLGGGSGNAATTLRMLNRLFDSPLAAADLERIAATLGSDVSFFLQDGPALARGRGEAITSLPRFGALVGAAFLLVHPGFGISTAWAYQELAQFPEALQGRPGRCEDAIQRFISGNLRQSCRELFNSLEAPALAKYPWLAVLQETLREWGAAGALMSGSGSTTFAIADSVCAAQELEERVKEKFGHCWTAVVPA